MMDKDLRPTKLEKIHCARCKDLMVKIYPNSSIRVGPDQNIPNCRKCIQKHRNLMRKGKFIRDLDRLGSVKAPF